MYKVFISSVQKEMEYERSSIAALIRTDPFLNEYLVPVLFDKQPLSGRKASKPYLDCLDSCQIYILLISREYGKLQNSISSTHLEYRYAQKNKLPLLIFVKGKDDEQREAKTKEFFNEIKADGYTYKRFYDRFDLLPELRRALIKVLKQEFSIIPTDDEFKSGADTLDAASSFETKQTEISWNQLDYDVAKEWLTKIGDVSEKKIQKDVVLNHLRTRGMLWHMQGTEDYFALAAGIIFLGRKPSSAFPHCRILADAYRGEKTDPNPKDQSIINAPAPVAIQSVIDFVNNNTRHPPRIVGLNRIVLNEYPEESIRESIVNAIAHRNYEDKSRAIMVEIFSNRMVVSSPGSPPRPLTISRLRRGKYLPCSRNPVVAQSLSLLKLMEQRGSGLARMKAAMLDHGLEAPTFDMVDGYFQVVLPGPGKNLAQLKIPAGTARSIILPSVENQLNRRQKKIVAQVLKHGFVTSGWCRKKLRVTYDTANRDFRLLIELKILKRIGMGPGTKYELVGEK